MASWYMGVSRHICVVCLALGAIAVLASQQQQQPPATVQTEDATELRRAFVNFSLRTDVDLTVGDSTGWRFGQEFFMGGTHRLQSLRSAQYQGVKDVTLEARIKDWRAEGGQVCLTVAGRVAGGGISRAVSLLNTALDFSMEQNVSFAYPNMEPPDHAAMTSFEDMFGTDPVCNNPVKAWIAICNKPVDVENDHRVWLQSAEGQCQPRQMVVHQMEAGLVSNAPCGCQKLVLMNGEQMKYHFDFERTSAELSDRYWSVHRRAPYAIANEKLSVVVHVQTWDDSKVTENEEGAGSPPSTTPSSFTEGGSYVKMLRLLTNLLPTNCMQLAIITDGPHDCPIMKEVIAGATKIGLPSPSVYGQDVYVVDLFDVMTQADVSVVAGSSFARVAAVLQPRSSACLAFSSGTFRFHDLPNVTIMPLDDEQDGGVRMDTEDEAVRRLQTNRALEHLAKRCTP